MKVTSETYTFFLKEAEQTFSFSAEDLMARYLTKYARRKSSRINAQKPECIKKEDS